METGRDPSGAATPFVPYVMTPTEIATGYLHGHVEGRIARGGREPVRAVLERMVGEALRRPPCVVAFSGGRDSSLILAVAASVARRDGLDPPIAATRRFADAPAADESDWQEQIVRHVGVDDWVRLDIGDAELDVVGPRSHHNLTEYGVLWPPMIHADQPLLEIARGGTLLDGEGGDEVLGTAAHRIAPFAAVVRSPRPLRRNRARSALGALAPGRMRADRTRRRWSGLTFDWLIGDAFERLVVGPLTEAERSQPLSFASSVARVPLRRTQVNMAANRRHQAARYEVEVASPLLSEPIVGALARDGGWLGCGSRADVLRALAGDLLPRELIERTSKATFSEVYFARHTRTLAAEWSGEGVRRDLVDVDVLRRLWAQPCPPPMTWALVQAAWRGLHG